MSATTRKEFEKNNSPADDSRESKLRVIPGGSAALPETPIATMVSTPDRQISPVPAKRSHLLVWTCVGTIAALAAFFFFGYQSVSSHQPLMDSFTRLEQDYRIFGIERYLDHKQHLRELVMSRLQKSPDSSEAKTARNIAVYLFPELLPNEDFEKDQALANWAPLERAIESSPRSMEARAWMEDLRATIWNYETPDRKVPRLSPYAEQTIRIYEALSLP